MYKVMGTGSRSMLTQFNVVEIYEILKFKIMLLLEQHPDLVLISGLAEGWDEAIAKIGMREGIPYHCYIPNDGFGEWYWGKKSQLGKNRLHIFRELLDNADDFTICCKGVYEGGTHSNFIRNNMMVEVADEALAYMPTYTPGTGQCIKQLKAANIPVSMYPFDS